MCGMGEVGGLDVWVTSETQGANRRLLETSEDSDNGSQRDSCSQGLDQY